MSGAPRTALRHGPAALALGTVVAVVMTACSAPPPTASSAGSGSASASPDAKLAPFDPNAPAGPPTGLDARVAFALPAPAPFYVNMGENLKQAAEDGGIEYVESIGDGNPAQYVEQLNQFVSRGVGALVLAPVDPAAQEATQIKAIKAGVSVLSLVATPATMQGNADQYQVGLSQGKAAAEYIKTSLAGKANVLYFNQDSTGAELQKRHKGVLDGLKTAGEGVEVVADVETKSVTAEDGFAAANTAIQAHPDISVVLGSDAQTVGAFRAIKQAGKLKSTMYFGGVDGDPDALALIAEGGAYRSSFGFAWSLLGYAYGKYAADWIAGKSIPRVLLVPPVPLTKDTVAAYNADMARAGAVFQDPTLRAKYLTELGNVSYADKDLYWTTSYSPS